MALIGVVEDKWNLEKYVLQRDSDCETSKFKDLSLCNGIFFDHRIPEIW